MSLERELDEGILELTLAADRHQLPKDVERAVERMRELRQRIAAGELYNEIAGDIEYGEDAEAEAGEGE